MATATSTPAIQQGRALLDAFNARDLAVWQRELAPGFTASYPGLRSGADADAARAFNAPFMAAFSDLHFQVHSAVADGARVTYAWTARGTHDGPLVTPSGTIPPSGRRGMVHGVLIATLEDGRIIREETYWNVLDLMAQIAPGAAAPPQAASAPSTAPARSEAVDLIRRCLDAFSAGDIPFFLSKVADDCTWSGSTSPEVPYAGQFTGPAGAGQFLDAIVGALDIKVFEFERLIGDGEHVVALGHWSGVARQTGRGFSARLALYFQVRDGRIVRTLGHEDTAVTAAALRA